MRGLIEVMEVACGARRQAGRRVCACARSLEGLRRGGDGCFHLPTSFASDVNKKRGKASRLLYTNVQREEGRGIEKLL